LPAQAGIQSDAAVEQFGKFWIPAFAGMTTILGQRNTLS
jgi:hypothetical protein